MKTKYLLPIFSFFLISSCCPSKKYFEEKFSNSDDQMEKVSEDLIEINSDLIEQGNEVSSIKSQVVNISIEIDSIKNNIDKSCYKTEDGIFKGTIVNRAKFGSRSNTLGIIEELNSHLEMDEFSMPGFIYTYNENNQDLKLGDTVEFKIRTSNNLSYAFDVKKSESDDELYEIGRTRKVPHINIHNGYYHPQRASHYKGHIIRLEESIDMELNGKLYELIEFDYHGSNQIDSLFVPKTFDPDGCMVTDRIYIFRDNLPGIDHKVILEIGCTHKELH